MRRRAFLRLLAATVASRSIIAFAQFSPRRPLIAVVIGASRAASERWRSGLPDGLKELGLIERRDYEIEYRYADGDMTRLPALMGELIRLRPTIIVAGNTAVAVVAERATASIPIVTAAMADPLSVGLAASVARPGGNVTGIISALDTLVGKQLEFGLELMPGTRRAGMLVNVNNLASSILM
jgi:putative tryptophan/tyrosine transport system substrate-binding protein